MSVTLTSLEALILKATNESLPCPDPAALEAFCAVMQQSPDGPQMAAQTLGARIHVPHTQKALLALAMTDRCMRKCGPDFHAEVGKFRFLNEMIKLVSPKYLADKTATEVKTRVLQLLHAWSIEYPQEFKFKVAYDMLKNQGVVKETPPPLPPEEGTTPRVRTKNDIFEDEEKSKLLQKLLQSKKPEDIQHANRLIKTMVREEERRNEASSRRAQEIGTALDSAGLLSDMLEYAESASPEEVQLIHELHSIVIKMRVVLEELASTMGEGECLNEILRAHDILDDIHEKYETFFAQQRQNRKQHHWKFTVVNNDSLLDFAGANVESAIVPPKYEPKSVAKNSIDELGDIFSTESGSDIAAPLQPVNLMRNDDVDLLAEKTKAEGWNELDSLGEQLLKLSLPDNARRVDSFNGKSKKVPMNALTSPKHEAPLNTAAVLDLDFFTKKPEDKPTSPNPTPSNDDVMVDITEPTLPNNNDILDLISPEVSQEESTTNKVKNKVEVKSLIEESSTIKVKNKGEVKSLIEESSTNKVKNKVEVKSLIEESSTNKVKNKGEVKSLTDINVTLESVQPSNVPPLTAFEEKDGVTAVLHFCKDKPRPDVNVVVISTTSRSSSPIDDYKIHCVVPKGCKVRLLTASGTSLPAFNPFLPPPALTQVMLIARPPASPPINLKFVLSYTVDEDVCSEIGEIKHLPLDDIQ